MLRLDNNFSDIPQKQGIQVKSIFHLKHWEYIVFPLFKVKWLWTDRLDIEVTPTLLGSWYSISNTKGILWNHFVGPLFIKQNWTENLYLDMLEITVKPIITETVETNSMDSIWILFCNMMELYRIIPDKLVTIKETISPNL